MDFDFLKPVSSDLINSLSNFHHGILGNQLLLHSEGNGFPEMEGVKIALFGVLEDRRDSEGKVVGSDFNFDAVRKEFYKLFPGNWHLKVADLGDIAAGASVEDTYYAIQSLVAELVRNHVIPVILGGGQDLVYAQYRAYDSYGRMVNLVNIDSCFDLGDAEKQINNKSYVGRMVVDQPYNLFNYSNLGYQTYFNPQEEIELIEKLFFEAYRLGEVSSDISIVEPVMRDADLVSLDMTSVASVATGSDISPPNGFSGKEICALARYAGISDKLTSFGIYEIQHLQVSKYCVKLVSQILWYFIEGVNYRKNELNVSLNDNFLKYTVPVDNEVLVFYKSEVSGRWWVEIPFSSSLNNKLKKHTLLPCTHQDYLEACNQNIPERWYKARRKNEI